MNSEYRRLNLKNTPLPICQHPHHCYHLVSFGNRSSGRGGASLQLAGLAVTRPPISRPPRLQPCAAHLLLLMQLQGHLLTSKMTQIEKTQVLFPKQKKRSQNQLVEVWRVNLLFSQPCTCTLCPRAAAQLCKDISWQLWRRKAISAEKAMVLLRN